MTNIRWIIIVFSFAALTACGGGSGHIYSTAGNNPAGGAGGAGGIGGGGGTPAAACSLGHLSEPQILSVTRTPPDAPLASLAHYEARNATRNPGAVLNSGACATNTSFRYATGVGDITGPTSGANMSGYVDGDQISTGLIDRQRARAFIFESDCEGRNNRAVLIQLDLGLAFHAIRQGVLDAIAADGTLSAFYNDQNLLLNASHSHSTAAGQSHFDAYHILTNGHDPQSYQAVIDGILVALNHAHDNLQTATPGPILFNQGELLNGNTNRSLPAFLNNPEAERQQFVDVNGDEVTTNRMMTLLRLRRDNGADVGMINWYPLHVTSIYQNNTLLSSDNKGYAAYRFEQDFDTDYFADETFLAGFMQADEGDASPHLFIPELSEAELRDLESDGFRNRGGGRTEPEHALISGFKQYRQAIELFNTATEQLTGEVSAGSIFIDFTTVLLENPSSYPPELQPGPSPDFKTCGQALGVSFAGGAEDGRGPTAEGQTCTNVGDLNEIVTLLTDNFNAGMNGALPPGLIVPAGCNNPVYNLQGYDCHAEKPIIFPLNQNSPFHGSQTLEPTTQKLQIVTLGNLAIIALPWEVTTTSGRRIRTAVLDALEDAGIDYAVISGLSNGFIHYMTTREEYATQQYEGASNVYGPWTQEAAAQELVRLATHLRNGTAITSPFANPGFRSSRSLFVNNAAPDDGNPSGAFGDVVQQPQPQYAVTADRVTVTARFIGGHPRNDLKLESSYVFVERMNNSGGWDIVQNDGDWFTRFEYQTDQSDGANHFVIDWILPPGVQPGTYRIRHEGTSAGPSNYSGVTNNFELLTCSP